MAERFLADAPLPYCKGCGHKLITEGAALALQASGLAPLDVVLVTDIGCHGIIDSNFLTHTVHGLHGRAVALGAGIAAARGRGKVLVYVGDGGAVIGLQHIVEAASRNFDMTVVVHNNMLYGMTGGQPSGLTPCGFRTPVCPEGKAEAAYDLCRLAHAAGAPYARRVIVGADLATVLAEALSVRGFALVEAVELCPSYGVKHNLRRKLSEIVREAGWELELLRNPDRPAYTLDSRSSLPSLLDESDIETAFSSDLARPVSVLLAGSAGEGVQQAAEAFGRAAIAAGLHVTKKGSYPVTVGTGFSAAEIIVSPEPVLYSGITSPDFVIITSADGLAHCRSRVLAMQKGTVLADRLLELPAIAAAVVRHEFRGKAGGRDAALYALFFLLRRFALFPVAALAATVRQGKLGQRVDPEALLKLAGD